MRRGDWQQVYTGRQFWPLDPRANEIDIEDIAHSLSNQCRFAGHVRQFYSVAQHSVLVSYACSPNDALWGLLHDASEAYLVDVPTPVKRHLSSYDTFEQRLLEVIAARFGLPEEMPWSVKQADAKILATEARDLMGPKPAPWPSLPDPFPWHIYPMPPTVAKQWFLERFRQLGGER